MEKGWKLHHVGVVVSDIEKVIEYYQSLGIATIGPKIKFDSKEYIDLMVYGKPADSKLKLKARMVQIGPVAFELLQPVEGDLTHKKFLESNGDGIQHIAFTVDDLDKETARLVAKGIPVIASGKFPTGGGFAYFDTSKGGNVIIELFQGGLIG